MTFFCKKIICICFHSNTSFTSKYHTIVINTMNFISHLHINKYHTHSHLHLLYFIDQHLGVVTGSSVTDNLDIILTNYQ